MEYSHTKTAFMEEKWTKVEDGLPVPGEKVLVVTKLGAYALCKTEIPTDMYGNILNDGKPEWVGSFKFTNTIAAWRTIPTLDIDIELKRKKV